MNNKKVCIQVLLFLLIVVFSVSQALSQSSQINIKDLKNLTYKIGLISNKPEKVKLTNGRFSRGDPRGNFMMAWIEKISLGDLNNDGLQDAAVILYANYGGSGSFAELAAVINDRGRLNHVSSVLLGDRVVIKSADIKSGIIVLNILTHGPKDPMATPRVKKVLEYKLLNNKLVKQ